MKKLVCLLLAASLCLMTATGLAEYEDLDWRTTDFVKPYELNEMLNSREYKDDILMIGLAFAFDLMEKDKTTPYDWMYSALCKKAVILNDGPAYIMVTNSWVFVYIKNENWIRKVDSDDTAKFMKEYTENHTCIDLSGFIKELF